MKFSVTRILFAPFAFAIVAAVYPLQQARAGQANKTELRAQFFRLCDVAVDHVTDPESKGPFFADSYAVRALCVAYDMTGNRKYLDACRNWSERMVRYQKQMFPQGAYYMHYNRKPGETTNDWFTADSSSIGMAVVATSVRCKNAEQRRLVRSAKDFAKLVINNYVKPSGGVSDGLWHQSSNAWWCSSALFGSFLFNLYATTGVKQYLKTALGVTDWLDKLDLTKKQPFPLSQQGPAMIFYVLENYSAGWPYIEKDKEINQAALAKVKWCLGWIAKQQTKLPADRQWLPTKGWGMKWGGLPFHEYIFSHHLAAGKKLRLEADTELRRLAGPEFAGKLKFNQFSAFLMMSYAERLDPGGIYRSSK